MRCAGLNTGPDFHLLDHIAPLAHFMQMPLLIAEEKNFDLAQKYYPQVDLHHILDLDLRLDLLADRFDALFECKYWLPHLKSLFYDLYRKKMKLIFCAHGQSDKGYKAPLLSPYSYHDLSLIYGDLLQTMIQELGIDARAVQTGNYRLAFYLQNKLFYDAIVDREIFSHLSPSSKTLLYAPTWSDADGATSFFNWAPTLFSTLPSDWNVIVKVHPLLEQRNPAQYYRTAALFENNPHVHLVSAFPPVYPILARCDAYLGDYSSVGYDYLPFQRPMYFLLHSNLPKGRLHECGEVIDSPQTLFCALSKPNRFAQKQQSLYRHAFGDPAAAISLREKILSHLQGEE